MLYDNMKQVVIKRLLKQEDSTLNRQFEDFAGFYGFKPILCRPYEKTSTIFTSNKTFSQWISLFLFHDFPRFSASGPSISVDVSINPGFSTADKRG